MSENYVNHMLLLRLYYIIQTNYEQLEGKTVDVSPPETSRISRYLPLTTTTTMCQQTAGNMAAKPSK